MNGQSDGESMTVVPERPVLPGPECPDMPRVGEEMIVDRGRDGMDLTRVTRVTPGGQIVCGNRRFNRWGGARQGWSNDVIVRYYATEMGDNSRSLWGGRATLRRPTEDDIVQIKRKAWRDSVTQRMTYRVTSYDFLSDDTIRAIEADLAARDAKEIAR